MPEGKVIVLEGLDGCGKSTQLELIKEQLADSGVKYRAVSFPDYESDAGRLVSRYLNGEIPCGGETGAYAASTFYAADRYVSFAADWKRDYDNGAVIVCGRYTTSNAIYQAAKISPEKRSGFLDWLWDYEYVRLGLPKPCLVMFLDMPGEVSQRLLSKRYGGDESKKDIHERDMAFLAECRETALFTARRCGWKIISCAENGEPLPKETVHGIISDKIKEILANG